MSAPLIIGAVLVGVAIIVIVIALGSRKPGDSLLARLAEYSMRETPATLEEIELSMPFSERILAPMVQARVRFHGALYAGQDAGINAPQTGPGGQPQQLDAIRILWRSRGRLRGPGRLDLSGAVDRQCRMAAAALVSRCYLPCWALCCRLCGWAAKFAAARTPSSIPARCAGPVDDLRGSRLGF